MRLRPPRPPAAPLAELDLGYDVNASHRRSRAVARVGEWRGAVRLRTKGGEFLQV